MTWADYLNRHAGSETGREVASKLGVTESNISRWRRGGQTPDVKYVVAFARAYGRPVLEALVEAEVITEEEAKARPRLAPDPDQLSDDDLLRILRDRLNRGGEERDRSAPTSPVRGLNPRTPDPEVSDADDELAPAAKHGVIEESGEFNT